MTVARAAACAVALLAGCQAPRETFTVERVRDGDTLVLADGRVVRIIGVDTPELSGDGGPECWAPEAAAWLGTLTGKAVELELDARVIDPVGRTLAHVRLEDGRLVSELLLERGLGQTCIIAPNLRYADRLREVLGRAQSVVVGLWSACRGAGGVVPPFGDASCRANP